MDFTVTLSGYSWTSYISNALFVDSVVRYCFAQRLNADVAQLVMLGANGTASYLQLQLGLLTPTSSSTSDLDPLFNSGTALDPLGIVSNQALAIEQTLQVCYNQPGCNAGVASCFSNQGMGSVTWGALANTFLAPALPPTPPVPPLSLIHISEPTRPY